MKCSTCGMVFNTEEKSKYITHTRTCIKEASFTLGNQDIVVKRNSQGLFLCYCSHPSCPKKGFSTISGLKTHMKKVKSTWIGPEGKVIPSFNLLKHISMLTKQCPKSIKEQGGSVSGAPTRARSIIQQLTSILEVPKSHIRRRADVGVATAWTCNGD